MEPDLNVNVKDYSHPETQPASVGWNSSNQGNVVA